MQKKYSVVIADTSCFILLDKINQIDLLRKVFGSVTTTEIIANEFTKPLPSWVSIQTGTNQKYAQLLEIEIDKGEASAIALALEKDFPLLILDDAKARKLASRIGLDFTGTLGIFLKAKDLGIISNVRQLLEEIQRTNFRFSEKVMSEILREANE